MSTLQGSWSRSRAARAAIDVARALHGNRTIAPRCRIGPLGEQPPEPVEALTELVMAATRRLMATTPMSAITIRAIAAEAGIQFSLVTRHYGSKDVLLREAIGQILFEWVVTMCDGPPDGFVDRTVDYLASHPFDVAAIRWLTGDESIFPDGRSPVVDAIVGYFAQAGQRFEAIDASATLSLILGWMAVEDHWVRTAAPAGRRRAPDPEGPAQARER
jgi:AcrR family transcriptional regulator